MKRIASIGWLTTALVVMAAVAARGQDTASGGGPLISAWNGDEVADGQAWLGPASPLNYLKVQSDVVHAGKAALELRGEGGGWIGGGWNWRGCRTAHPFRWAAV